jgi:UDP-sugar pyrophosphorylase
MYIYQAQTKTNVLYRSFCFIITLIVLCAFAIPPQYVYAQAASQSVLDLPEPGTMVPPAGGFTPCIIKGITIHSDNPLRFDFILDTGEEIFDDQEVRDCSRKLVKYFLAALTVSEKKMWVNLSPYENNRIISDELGKTEMGRDMLAQDYILKQLTSSMMYPEDNLGAEFWYKVYAKAQEHYGTTDIPLNTFNKIWIIPEKAEIFELGSRAFVVESHLKVMLEEDFIALQNNLGKDKFDTKEMGMNEAEVLSGISAEVVREVLIPEIEREVNQGKNFAQLRQIYHSMILATWYKMRLKDSLLSRVYVNKGKTKGVENADKEINTKIYDQYLAAFQKGVYNYIKEDYDPATQQIIPRKYFSGGETFEDLALLVTPDNMLGQFSLTEAPSLVEAIAPLNATQRTRIVNALDTDTNFEVTVDLAELGAQAQDVGSVVDAIVNAEADVQDDLAMMTMGVMSNNAQQLLASVRAQFEVTGREAIFALNDIFAVVGLNPQQDRLDEYVRELETKNPKAAEIFPWIVNNNLRKSYNASLNYVRSEIAARAALDDAAVRQFRNQLQDALSQIAVSGLDLAEWNVINQSFIRDDTASNLLRAEVMQGKGPFQAGERFRQDTEALARRRQAILSDYARGIAQDAAAWRENLENEANDSGQAFLQALNTIPGLQGLSTVEQYRVARRVYRYVAQSVGRHKDDVTKSMQAIYDDSLYFGKLLIDRIAAAQFGEETAAQALYRSIETIGRSFLTPADQQQIDNLEPNRQSSNLKVYYLSQLFGSYGTATVDQAMLTITEDQRAKLNETVLANIDAGIVQTNEQMRVLATLVDIGQEWIVNENWEAPGVNDDKKRALLDQLARQDQNPITGSLADYYRRGREQLQNFINGVNPFEGYTPDVPEMNNLLNLNEDFLRKTDLGLQHINKSAFALVAGGLGTRLGYGGLKVGMPLDLVTAQSYIQLFAQNIKALQRKSNNHSANKSQAARTIPFIIMTSDQTHQGTIDFLRENNFFGLDGVTVLDLTQDKVFYDAGLGQLRVKSRDGQVDKGGLNQITIFKQESVPAMQGYEGQLYLKDQYTLDERPHNHGDIHILMHASGIAQALFDAGTTNTLFFQDTNGQVFNSVLPGLGNAIENGDKMNFLAVARDVGSNIGAIALMSNVAQNIARVFNIEYNLVANTEKGDVADPETGYSIYPGNMNVFFLDQEMYVDQLQRTGGIFGEIVNPKPDAPHISRLEAPMQDIAQYLTADQVGVSNFTPRMAFAATKNGRENALISVAKGVYPEAMVTSEASYYQYNRFFLNQAGVDVTVEGEERLAFPGEHIVDVVRDADGKEAYKVRAPGAQAPDNLVRSIDVAGIPYVDGAKVVYTPDFAVTPQEVTAKVKGGRITDRSVVLLDGENITWDNVSVDGTLIVRTRPGVSVTLQGTVVENAGWDFVDLTEAELESKSEPVQMRGYDVVRNDQMVIDLTDAEAYAPGDYIVDEAGRIRMINTNLENAVSTFAGQVQANALQINGAIWRSIGQDRLSTFIRETSGLTPAELPDDQIAAMTNPVQGASLSMISARTGISNVALLNFIQQNMTLSAFQDSFAVLLSQEMDSAAVSEMVQEAWKVFAPLLSAEPLTTSDLADSERSSDLDLAMMSMDDIRVIKDFLEANRALGVLIDFEGNAELWQALGLHRDESQTEAFATYEDFIRFLEEREDDLRAINGLGLYFSDVGRGVVVDKNLYVEPMIAMHNAGRVKISYELARAISGATQNLGIARVIDDIYAESFDQAMLTPRDRQVMGQMFNAQKGQVVAIPAQIEQQVVQMAQLESRTETRFTSLQDFTTNERVQAGLLPGEKVGIYFAGVGIGFLASTAGLATLVNNIAQQDTDLAFQLAVSLAGATDTRSYQAIFKQTALAKMLNIANPLPIIRYGPPGFSGHLKRPGRVRARRFKWHYGSHSPGGEWLT